MMMLLAPMLVVALLPRLSPPLPATLRPALDERQLFLDLDDVDAIVGAALRVHRPREVGEPEFMLRYVARGAWCGFGNVLDNGTHVLLYYCDTSVADAGEFPQPPKPTAGVTCVLISADRGLSFSRPSLGILSINGSRDNNCLLPAGGTVFLDANPAAPLAERYKLLGDSSLYPEPPAPGTIPLLPTYAFSSADGLHFRPMSAPGAQPQPAYRESDSQDVSFWDPNLGQYVAYRRVHLHVHKSVPVRPCNWCVGQPAACGEASSPITRQVARCVSPSLNSFAGCESQPTVRNWSDPLGTTTMTANETLALSFDLFDSPCVDIYTSQAVMYDSHYLAFPAVYLHYPGHSAGWGVKNDGNWDVRFAASRTGERFDYVGGDRRPWLGRGVAGGPPTNTSKNVFPPGAAWDSGIVHVLQGFVRDESAGVTRMWKLGSPARHGQQDLRPGVPVPLGVSRLEIRRDGWASVSSTGHGCWPPNVLQTGVAPGDAQVIIRPVTLPTSTGPLRLVVNVDTANSAELRVEVRDQRGHALPNRSAEDTTPIVGNFLNTTVRWMSSDASVLPPGSPLRVVQLRFTMRGEVSLYSWWLAEQSI